MSRSLLRRDPLQRSHCHACYSFSINKDIDRERREGVRGVLSLYGVMFPGKRDKRDKRDIGCSAGDFSVTVGVTKSKKRDTTKKRDKRDKPCGAREVSVTVDLSR